MICLLFFKKFIFFFLDKFINIIWNIWDIVLDYECGYIEGYVKIIYLVCIINGEFDCICIKNKDGIYVEEKLIVYLEVKYIVIFNVICIIIVYINNFFCYMCV